MARVLPLFLLAVAALHAQDFSHVQVERIAKGLRFAEGPVWSYEGFLLFSDGPSNLIRKWTPGIGEADYAQRPGGAGGNAFDTEGRLYSCEFRERRVVRLLKNGKTEILASRFEGKRLNAPNDIIVRRDGHVFFTDPAFGAQQDTRELDFFGVYHITPRGELEIVARWKTRPNGITLSPNGKTLYVADSDLHQVRAYDLDGKGQASNERVVISKIEGVPDGMRTDEKGNLYVAAKGVLVYSAPNTGAATLLGSVGAGENASDIAFGDPDLETLYITAGDSVFRVRLGVKGALQY